MILITGVPRAGKTTLAATMAADSDLPVRHTDDLLKLEWSEASLTASAWLDEAPAIIEGVAVPRAVRKWLARSLGKPADVVFWMGKPRVPLNPGQARMAAGCLTVFRQIIPELLNRGVRIEEL